MVERRDKRSCQEQHGIKNAAHTNRKPKDCVEMPPIHLLAYCQHGGKAAFLKVAGNDAEYRQKGYKSVILHTQQTGQGYACEHRNNLLGTIAKG